MKRTQATALVLLLPWLSTAQQPPDREGVSGAAKPAEVEPVSVPVPVVRVPGALIQAPAAEGGVPPAATVASEAGPVPEGASTGTSPVSAELGWSPAGVGLREPAVTAVRTNRGVEIKGVVPRVTRPERRGFGGFLSGFANLFNPFAPTAKGVETRGEHWYDGGVQRAPLPRGLRDERAHEPQTALFSTDFGAGSVKEKPSVQPVRETGPAAP